jgi:hypothetical protein
LVLYEGGATISETMDGKQTLMISTSLHAMAVGLGPPSLVCHQHGYSTEHPKLSVIVGTSTGFFFQKSTITPENLNMFLYTNSKFVFLERHFAGQFDTLYAHFHAKICMLKHTSLMHLISLAYISPTEFAWAYTQKPGVTALLRGEAIYTIHCEPVTVELLELPACYQEIPVSYRNQTRFLQPRTRILQEHGNEIDCNPLAPAIYQIGDHWFQMKPHPSQVMAPFLLNPTDDDVWVYQSPSNLMSAGLYSPTDLEKFQKRLMFSAEKTAINNIIVSRAGGVMVDSQNVNIGRLFAGATMTDIHESLLHRIYGVFWEFSVYVAGISGFLFILMLLKTVINMCINGTMLYRAYGCSYKVITAFWGTIAKHLLYFHALSTHIETSDKEDEDNPSEPTAPEEASLPVPPVPEKRVKVSRLYPRLDFT